MSAISDKCKEARGILPRPRRHSLRAIERDIVSGIASDALIPGALLLQALRTLTPEEQGAVISWLLSDTGMSGGPVPSISSSSDDSEQDGLSGEQVSQMIAVQVAAQARFGNASLGDAQVVPVRFPVPLYDRLKAWSGANGFPIAAVVRGLVEKFLDDQAAGQA